MSKQPHIPALDGLRGIAVLAVMLVHLGGGAQSHNVMVHLFGAATRYGWAGVTLFFVLSGFLITGILWDSKGSPAWWRNFFIRRSLRIFPLYYGSLLLNIVVSAILGFGWKTISSIWIFALYLQNFPSVGHQWTLGLPLAHYWSLAVEEQFYLIWPWILLKVNTLRQAQAICLAVILLSTAVNICFGFNLLPWLHRSFFANMGALAAGGFLAFAYRSSAWQRVLSWAPVAILFGSISFMVIDHLDNALDWTVGLPLLSILCAGLLMLCLRPGFFNHLMSTRWLRWIGSISYGLYVYHVLLRPFFVWIADHIARSGSREAHLGLVFVIGMCLSFLSAALSFRYFEEPLLKLKKKFPVAETVSTRVGAKKS